MSQLRMTLDKFWKDAKNEQPLLLHNEGINSNTAAKPQKYNM